MRHRHSQPLVICRVLPPLRRVDAIVSPCKGVPRQDRATNHYSGPDHYKWPLPPLTAVERQGRKGTYKNVSYQLRLSPLPAHLIKGQRDGLAGSITSIKDRPSGSYMTTGSGGG